MTIDPKIIAKAAKRLFDEDSAWAVATYDEKQYHREAAERALLAVAADLTNVARADAWDEGHRAAHIMLPTNPPQYLTNPYRQEKNDG